jgi:hypothetical protein
MRRSLAGQLVDRGKQLGSAKKYMFKLKMEHAVLDEMTAQAERLRFELEAWK